MEEKASCSSSGCDVRDQDLAQLTLEQGINIWGQDQHTLEQQALQEIENFTHQTGLEEGELSEDKKEVQTGSLDVELYIKRQQELKKIQEYKKSLCVESKSKIIADRISEKCKNKLKRKRNKSKTSEQKKVKLEEKPGDKDAASGSEYFPSDGEIDSAGEISSSQLKKQKQNSDTTPQLEKLKDDGSLAHFHNRLEQYYQRLEAENCREEDDPEAPDYYTIKGGLKIPMKIWSNLYTYQQEGVRWLWGIHRQTTGGILGDEMGLGKTVQVIAFLSGLVYTQTISFDCFKGLGPTLIVCPVTVIDQWVKHFHDWAPEFRVAVLHNTGSFQGKKSDLIKDINKNKGILITSYVGILKYKENLAKYNWHYLILDEGHKIRNPNAKVSVAVKQIRTPHRLMLTGSPMQNNLQELWSLFDFTNPGMLGNLNTFVEHFNNPIVQGGFTNSTPMQEATALSVATTLKDLISPFLLRRSKSEVQSHISLPNKSEQVLFCSLTPEQKDFYKGYLTSDHVNRILGRNSKNWFAENQTRASVLVAITALRKICNHPDIYLHEADQTDADDPVPAEDDFGHYKKSGKMIVVSALLKIWKKQKHRVLLFTQSRAMIAIFEHFLKQQQYKFLKMDGSTPVGSRQPLINKFNEDCSYDVFLLTTRVGGLGVNLTGADRVIIYDPDWNPATDTQARERAWRIGQDKEVTIYRLLSAGSIEEKMYQRQVWKQLLSNKVLIDPKTHKFFKSSSLHDLLSLPEDAIPETTNIFRHSRIKFEQRIKEKRVKFSEDKIQQMKNLAHQIAMSIKPVVEQVQKSSFQVELEEQRLNKLQQKEDLKKLTPVELRNLNRGKVMEKPEPGGNTVDGSSADFSFAQALEFSEESSKAYTETKKIKTKKKLKDVELLKSSIDVSGTVEGEKVEGLVKTEVKKVKKKFENAVESGSHDQYILEKLFSKKGVSGALQHDSVLNSGTTTQSLKVQTEAKLKADKALEALRKSRLNSWRW